MSVTRYIFIKSFAIFSGDISSISNLSSISVTHVNETEFTMRNDTFASRTRPTQAFKNDLSMLDAIDVRRPSCDSYLNGCKVPRSSMLFWSLLHISLHGRILYACEKQMLDIS